MPRQRLLRPQLADKGAALRAVLSCLVLVLLMAGPVAFCDVSEHVVAEPAPQPLRRCTAPAARDCHHMGAGECARTLAECDAGRDPIRLRPVP